MASFMDPQACRNGGAADEASVLGGGVGARAPRCAWPPFKMLINATPRFNTGRRRSSGLY